jgi:hypothetical protein
MVTSAPSSAALPAASPPVVTAAAVTVPPPPPPNALLQEVVFPGAHGNMPLSRAGAYFSAEFREIVF